MMLQFFQLTLCHFAIIYSLGSRRPANDPRTPSSSKMAERCRVLLLEESSCFSSSSSSSSSSLFLNLFIKPIFVLAFIVAQTAVAAALFLRVKSLAVMRFRAFSASILSTCRSARSLLCEYAIWRHAAFNELLPRSLLANHFSNRVSGRKIDIREYAVRKEMRLSHDKRLDGIRCNSLSKAPICV